MVLGWCMRSDCGKGTSASPATDGNLYVWNATIIGPDASPWEGGIFPLVMIFPKTYPDAPPKIQFHPTIYHPNGTAEKGRPKQSLT